MEIQRVVTVYYTSPRLSKTQNIYDWQIHEICDNNLLIVYTLYTVYTEIVLFKRSVIVFKINKSLQVGVYYNFVTVY